ncbi:MAG: HNH endonuclease [Gemmataceae bacterium]
MGRLEVEHIIPKAHVGTNDESNLWLSCSLCNRAKADQISATDPVTGDERTAFPPPTPGMVGPYSLVGRRAPNRWLDADRTCDGRGASS